MKETRQAPPKEALSMRDLFAAANEHRDYTIYTTAMDAALEAKAHSIFPHLGDLPESPAIVDVGSGSGKLAELAAREFHGARVYALDYSHELLELAEENKTFLFPVYGNAVDQHFAANSLDAAYVSTSGHEMESFGGEGTADKVVATLFTELKPGARMVWRDFAKPSFTEPVYLRINSTVGDPAPPIGTPSTEINYSKLSPEAIFECFHREFDGGDAFEYEQVEVDGQAYIKLSPEWAHEYYLRKDYTANFRQEILEKYTYWTPEQAIEVFEEAGFTNVEVVPEHNEWIIENRLKGKIELHVMGEDGALTQIDFPPTHMVVVGDKPASDREVEGEVGEFPVVDYDRVLASIEINEQENKVTIGQASFAVLPDSVKGGKKICFYLEGDAGHVLKVIKPETLNAHNACKALFQTIERQHILEKHNTPNLAIKESDIDGPPYRYVVQEAAPEGAEWGDMLVRTGQITKRDIKQIAAIVNTYEKGRQWQLDTNPFSWFRTTDENGETQMVYASGKVYRYEESWKFVNVGLWQWLEPAYVEGSEMSTASIPTVKDREMLMQMWEKGGEMVDVWKEELDKKVWT
jgi:SAM-dependent methyltransferase